MAFGKPVRTDTKPWYKQFWPWLVIFFPTLAVVAGIATVIIAVKTDDGLVESEYYKKGMLINFSKEMDQNADSLGLKAYARLDSNSGELYLLFDETDQEVSFENLSVQLKHATRSDKDQTVTVTRKTQREFRGVIDQLSPGKWHILVESGKEWRLKGTIKYPDRVDTRLQPSV